MTLFTAQIFPGQALGPLVLGASLHDVLTRLKAEPQQFPKLNLLYSPARPVQEPVILSLPINGIRLRFDGPHQRLRLIEVTDFTKNKLSYNHVDVVKHSPGLSDTDQTEAPSGPTFKHVYQRLIGPTFAGEYIPPESEGATEMGLYILSYTGIAFSFPIPASSYLPEKKTYVSILSSSTTQPAASMAIFSGDSWVSARSQLYTKPITYPRVLPQTSKGREQCPDEVILVRILGGENVELVRSSGASFRLKLNETTPQELVAELGPPDAIYRKNDQRMMIHKSRSVSETRGRSKRNHSRGQDDSTDTDVSSAHTATDDEDDGDIHSERTSASSGDCFYNYFYHGFDILVSIPSTSSPKPPSLSAGHFQNASVDPNNLVVTKMILHSNVPGSYPFNRHRRCRWEVAYLGQDRAATTTTSTTPCASSSSSTSATSVGPLINSETKFESIASQLHEEWKSIYASPQEARQRQRGMVLNRGWGDSPGSSCELLGGWEDSVPFGSKQSDITAALGTATLDDDQGLGNTTLFGFPGLVFEVLKNGTVSALTIF